jgi:hypothetical protein
MKAKQSNMLPPRMELARAYVPFQMFNQVLSPQEGLRRGTIFPELVRPYYPENRGVYEGGT